MGFFGKLKFWKKEDDFSNLGFEKELGGDLGGPLGTKPNDSLFGQDNLGLDYPTPQGTTQTFASQNYPPVRPQPAFQQPYQQPLQQGSDRDYIVSKEIEVLSSKIDAIRVTMESINQRLARIEKIAEASQDDQQRNW